MTVEAMHALVERLARALGVWARPGDPLGAERSLAIWLRDDGQLFVHVPDRDRWSPAIPVDAQTALLMLLGHARGVVLDVGPWARALLDALPREWTQAANGRVGPDALRYLRETAERRHAAFVDAPQWVHAEGGQLQVRMRSPGDPTARTALTAWSGAADIGRYERLGWADTVDDTLAVWHDDHLARGDVDPDAPWQVVVGGARRWTNAAPVGLAEHPTLARLTAAWLAGKCARCSGKRVTPVPSGYVLQRFPGGHVEYVTELSCEPCNGTGTALGSKTAELAAEAERAIATHAQPRTRTGPATQPHA